MKAIKHILFIAAIVMISGAAIAQEEISRELRSFDKVVASPRINLILEKGDQEGIRVVYAEISESKINIEVKGKTLRIYLDDARVIDKLERVSRGHKRSVYANASVTAYVTYRELRHLEIRGQQELTCKDPIKAKKFTLKAYGENEIELASIKTDFFKTALYGENRLKVNGGRADYQKYKLYGENKIDSRELKSFSATTTIFGESKIKLTTEDELKVNAFGESDVRYGGNAYVNRGLVFGEVKISRMD
jgi:hypothetical protein